METLTSPRAFSCETCQAKLYAPCVTRDGRERSSVHASRREAYALYRARLEADEVERNAEQVGLPAPEKREVTSAACKSCGALILWIPRPASGTVLSGWHPPHEELPEERVLVRGEIRTYPVVVRHVCGEDRLAKYATERAERTAAFRAAREAARREVEEKKGAEVAASVGIADAREGANEAALAVECPKCGMKPTNRCENLLERKNGVVRKTSWPHAERLALAGWEGPTF